MKTNTNFTTSDFLTAAFLLSKGVRMEGERAEGRRMVFVFDSSTKERCEKLAEQLLHGDDQVSARRLHESMKQLKRIIYDS